MSAQTIKHGFEQLLIENIPALEGHILTQFPRTQENSKAPVIVLWMRRAPGNRVAGSGRSMGPIHGVKQIVWQMAIHVVDWATIAQADADKFEQMIADILQVVMSSIDLAGKGDNPSGGSQVLTFGEVFDIENEEPVYSRQYLTLQSTIVTQVVEIYNV